MERRPTLVDCPTCGTHLALLPNELYTSVGGVDPSNIRDAEGNQDAVFAILDAESRYICPNCHQLGKLEH
jgi:predicted RNA-binding Zn-ribbon protein involved in translation (DUF1610 family)